MRYKDKNLMTPFAKALVLILVLAMMSTSASALRGDVIKTVINGPDFYAGDTINYEIKIINPNNAQITIDTIRDIFPDGSMETLDTGVVLAANSEKIYLRSYLVRPIDAGNEIQNEVLISGQDGQDTYTSGYTTPTTILIPHEEQDPDPGNSSLRIYGEDCESAAFPYSADNPQGPFDTDNYEAPPKDFVTFNPAIVLGNTNPRSHVNNQDANVKTFMRQWYAPVCYEPFGEVWLENPNHNVASSDIITEYTYMLVDTSYNPVAGTALSPSGAFWTKFWFPIADNDDNQIGIDGYDADGDGVDDITVLRRVGDFNADGRKDVAISTDTFELVEGEELQFLDHMVRVKNVQVISGSPALISIMVDVYYTGNDEPELIVANHVATILPNQYVSAGRHTIINGVPNFENPWFLQAISTGGDRAYVAVGRLLHTGESFFVDASEYDVAMIYGPDRNSVKYITIRDPIPEEEDVNLQDLSVIKRSVDFNETLPVLPPFNDVHTMVDDINIEHGPLAPEPSLRTHAPGLHDDDTNIGARLIPNVAALDIQFISRGIEVRYNTSLLEILDEVYETQVCILGSDGALSSCTYVEAPQAPPCAVTRPPQEGTLRCTIEVSVDEQWQWLKVQTMPDLYKEFVYPALPDVDDGHGDYIVTLSFRAPNSNYERVKFVYDSAVNAKDIYVNDDGTTNTLRLYGENGLSAAFPYTDPEAPFDPLNEEAPVKDFVTLNPAVQTGIVVDNVDSKMKTFMRQWFVPEYEEPTGMVWLDTYNTEISEDIVSEYSFMFVDNALGPKAGTALSPSGAFWTRFWFPIADNDDNQIGLDGYDVDGDGVDDMTVLRRVGDFNADGRKDVAISTTTLELVEGDEIQFLDHKIVVNNVQVISGTPALISLMIDVYYTGNDDDELILANYVAQVLPNGFVSAGRHTVFNGVPDFESPWFLQAISTGGDRAYVVIGRLLHTGESFFVDASEYDVAMIYGPTDESVKYITLRNPVPEDEDVNLQDLSVIKKSVAPGEVIPVLPPFNRDHTMVDDINIEHGPFVSEISLRTLVRGLHYDGTDVLARLIRDVEPLEIKFVSKGIEPRFHTNLLEILDEEGCDSIDCLESWDWRHIWTMPEFYKEFDYPKLPDIDGGFGDYLVTSSFIAPNADDTRVMFAYDAEDGTGLYINEIGDGTGGVQEPTSCTGDIQPDGEVDGGDITLVINAWGQTTYPPADVNQDGEVDGGDITLVINNWGCTSP